MHAPMITLISIVNYESIATTAHHSKVRLCSMLEFLKSGLMRKTLVRLDKDCASFKNPE